MLDSVSFMKIYKNIDGIDYDLAASYLPDDDLIIETVESVFSGMLANKDEVLMHFNKIQRGDYFEKDVENYRIKVHSMKSTILMIGAQELSTECRGLEMAARAMDTEYILENTETVLNNWMNMYNRLKPLFEGPTESKPMYKDDSALIVSLQKIGGAMEDYDIDEADSELKKIMSFSYPDEIQVLVDDLASKVRMMDSQGVTDDISNIIDIIM